MREILYLRAVYMLEDKRRKALQERRFQRERRIEESIAQWERHIVPDWTVVMRNNSLRRLWWQGIPSKLRAMMWQNAIGNSLALSKGEFSFAFVISMRSS